MKSNTEIHSAPRRPGRRPVDRRSEILDAAQRLYAEIGFEKTTIGDVAEALGMSPANLYRSFPNRRAIDEAVAARRLGLIEDAAWASARKAPTGAGKAFRELALTVLRTTRELLFSQNRMNHLCAVAARERWPVVEQYMHGLHGAVRHVILEGQRTGEFASCDPEAITATVIAAMMKVWHPYMLEIYKDDDLEAEAAQLCELILASLAHKE